MSRFSATSMRRRDYLLATTTLAGIGVAGCIEGDDDGNGVEDEDATGEDSDPGPQIDSFSAEDIAHGDGDQRVRVTLTDLEPGEERDIYLDASSLSDANVGIADLGVVADTHSFSTRWTVTDAELSVDDGIEIRVRARREEEGQNIGTINIDLTGLETAEIEHDSEYHHHATIATSDGEPDFRSGETAAYRTIIPDEIENELRVAPGDIRIGDDSQEISISIDSPTPTIDFRLDLAPVSDANVDISTAEVIVEESIGETRDGEVDVTVTDANVADGIVQLGLAHEADLVHVTIRVTNLETSDAEATTSIAYPVYTGERPSDPQESGSFRISGATA